MLKVFAGGGVAARNSQASRVCPLTSRARMQSHTETASSTAGGKDARDLTKGLMHGKYFKYTLAFIIIR